MSTDFNIWSNWTDATTYIIIITLGLGNVLVCNTIHAFKVSATSYHATLDIIALIFEFITAFTFFISLIRWFKGIFKTQKISELMYPLIYLVMTVLCIITLFVIIFTYERLTSHDKAAILVYSLIYFCYMIFIIFLSMRMVKSEVIQ
jgi:hypothetical protein